MRLNPDCIRDILMSLEEITETGGVTYTFSDYESFRTDRNLLQYRANEIEYHLRQCDMSGMLIGAAFGGSGSFSVRDISPKAHEFLANIRDEQQWSAVKKGLSAIRNYSLSAVSAMAEGVTSATINAYLSGQTNP